MTAAGAIGEGLRRAMRHPTLVLWNWLVPLLPAALLASMISAGLTGVYDRAPYASRVLEGDWSGPWGEYLAWTGAGVFPVLAGTLALLMVLTAVVRVAVSAGTVEVLLERPDAGPKPFWTGMGLHFGRFLRCAIWFGLAMVPGLILGAIVFRMFRKFAESRMDGRYDLWGAAMAAVVVLLLALPALLAYDFGRIAVARHQHGRTLRALLAGIFWALLRFGRLVVLYVLFTAASVLVPVAWSFARGGWSPSSTAGIAGLVLAGQIVLLVRAYLRVSLFGAEVALYEAEGGPGLGARPSVRAAPAARVPAPEPAPRAPDYQI